MVFINILMINSTSIAKIRNIDNYKYKDKIKKISDLCETFLKNNDLVADTKEESQIPKEKEDICYHLEFKNKITTMYENGQVDVDDDYNNLENLKDFNWYFLKFYDQSLNEHISESIKKKYSLLINEIQKLPITYGAFHHCSSNTFIFEHYDQTTSPEGSETGRTNIIVPLHKPKRKGCIIHVDGEKFDLMDYDAFCFNAQFKHKMYNDTGDDVILLVLHSRSSDFEIVSQV